MKILVTGGAGFLGGHLIPRLAASGHEIFALSRSSEDSSTLRALGATPIAGDLTAVNSIELPAVDAVVHLAAYFRFAGPREPYFKTNVEGTNLGPPDGHPDGRERGRMRFQSAAGAWLPDLRSSVPREGVGRPAAKRAGLDRKNRSALR